MEPMALRQIARLAAVVLLTAGLGTAWFYPYLFDWIRPAALPPAVDIGHFGDRILFIAPHPDDETLGGAGLIQQALAAGKEISVVLLTCGDGYRRAAEHAFAVRSPSPADYRRLGELRRQETLAAMKILGLPEGHTLFFGFPDGGLHRLWEDHWAANRPYRGLNGATEVPYSFGYRPGTPYTGTALVQLLSDVMEQFHPSDIVYPDPFDQHPDHWAASAFVKCALYRFGKEVREWTYLVHRGDYPVPWMYEPFRALVPPKALTQTGNAWFSLPLSEGEEEKKFIAIRQYISQIRVIGPFLEAFVRRNDLLSQVPDPILPVDEKPDLEAPNRPYLLFRDAVRDNVGLQWKGAADIHTVSSVRAPDGWYIGIQTRKPPARSVTYGVHARLFYQEGRTEEIDLYISDNTVHADRLPPVDDPGVPRALLSGDRMWVALPVSLLHGVQGLMLEADTRVGDRIVDRSPWRWIWAETKTRPTG